MNEFVFVVVVFTLTGGFWYCMARLAFFFAPDATARLFRLAR